MDDRHEEHLTAEEDDGSAELQPEDGGTAEPGASSTTASTTTESDATPSQ